MNLQSLFCGILFCISVAALIIACLAFAKGGGGGECYTGAAYGGKENVLLNAQQAALQRATETANKIMKLGKHADNSLLKALYMNCYLNSIKTTVIYYEVPDPRNPLQYVDRTFVITGAFTCYGPPGPKQQNPEGTMSQMWIRDGTAQMHSYLSILEDNHIKEDYRDAMRKVILGFIENAATCLGAHPKAHAFNPNLTPKNNPVNYEADTPAFFLWLVCAYYDILAKKKTKEIMSSNVLNAIDVIVKMYRWSVQTQEFILLPTDYRPSDDLAERRWNIPINMFIETVFKKILSLPTWLAHARKDTKALLEMMQSALETNIPIYGIKPVLVPGGGASSEGKAYVYEVDPDNLGSYTKIGLDDANLPSLLSIPYLSPSYIGEVYNTTRHWILTPFDGLGIYGNPYYFSGTDTTTKNHYSGIGSKHTSAFYSGQNIWPLSLVVQGYTAIKTAEKENVQQQLINSAVNQTSDTIANCPSAFPPPSPASPVIFPSKNYLHESFSPYNPAKYTRGWFAWANAFFGEWIDNLYQ